MKARIGNRWIGVAATALVVSALGGVAAAAETVSPDLFREMKWRNIGPYRGGRSVAVAGVVQDPKTFYFGGAGGGVFKTTDGGESWTNVSDGFFRTASVGAIAVAPSDPNVVYVGMGEHAVRGVTTSHGDGVYKSTDGGRTWTHVGLEKTRAIARIRVHPRNPDLVYVAAQGAPYGPTEERGVYRSTDGGRSWEKVLFVGPTAGASELDLDPSNPRVLFAGFWDHERKPWEVRSGGPGSGLYKSVDGGTTWEKLSEGLPELMGKTAVAVSASSERVYALVEADPGGGLYRSDDGGKSWRLVNDAWGLRTRAWYYIEVFADPKNPDVVWVMNARAWKSIDGGKSFVRIRTPHGDNHDLWIHPEDPNVLINANDGGANVSYDGGASWSTQANQPTAQFYRVNTDDRFPYWVYGGQQDNTTVAIRSRTATGGIGWKDWHAVGGCESGYVAFDRKSPTLVYAGCYMGQITEYDDRTGLVRNVMAYPILPAAIPPREMKYRFNWNAPIVVSQHDPRVVYHAANVLLRSEDRGRTWSEASPDLTRNDPEKQGPGGRPITNEGAGGEIYNTIFYVAESPHDPRTLWVGSDDGLVHVTRDGGARWENVTPEELGEAIVNAIEVSPHEPETVYIAASRYKFNDFTPLAYKTTDGGRSWTRITDGIAADAWVRVVREDPVRRGLLYAGTETGVYVSFDDGAHWQSLQLNLPVTPITDLRVAHGDLVAATQGRAFWILDDLSPLRQIDETVAGAAVHLFRPRPATRFYASPGFGSQARQGANPPPGAIIDFVVAEEPDAPVRVDILDAEGALVRSYSTEKEPVAPDEDNPGMVVDRPLEVEKGMNRIAWDLRYEPVTPVPGLYVFGSLAGRKVVPGTYRVRLTVGGETREAPLEVVPDPRLDATIEDYREQERLVARIDAELAELHRGVVRLRSVREQVAALVERIEGRAGADAVVEAGRRLVAALDALEDELVQKRTVDGQTVINFPMRLNQFYIYLRNAADSGEGTTTEGVRRVLADLGAEWATHRAELERLLGPELDALNRLVREASIPAVLVPPE